MLNILHSVMRNKKACVEPSTSAKSLYIPQSARRNSNFLTCWVLKESLSDAAMAIIVEVQMAAYTSYSSCSAT